MQSSIIERKAVRGNGVQEGGFEVDLVTIDQGRRILLMVTKEAAMSFSQFGYPYNATSQVSL